jgi:putative PIN family toxin of toxin-antitoxin system
MSRRPVVVDTNVLVSGLLTLDERAPTARIVDSMLRGEFYLLLSMDLLAEYRTVLLRPAIRKRHGLSDADVDELLGVIAEIAAFRETRPVSDAERRKDAHLHRLLSAAKGAILVTGDEALRRSPPSGIEALAPKVFLSR